MAAGLESAAITVTIQPGPSQEGWLISGDGTQLVVSCLGPLRRLGPSRPQPPALAGLSRFEGSVTAHGEAHQIDCLGWWQSWEHLMDEQWSSLSQVAAWFSTQFGLALASLRPGTATRHAEATVSAAVLGDEDSSVEESRLSSTYRDQGQVFRAGIELWLATEQSDDLYPLRAAGESVGPPLDWEQDGVWLQAEPFRWFSRQQEGAGLYLRGRR